VAVDACVVFEDAAAGVEAAGVAGMYTVGLGPVERVGQADLVLPDLASVTLSDILQRLAATKPGG
jgi:beta-phosphoglucomutase-like phosphatase (HAD superfamily)